MQGAEDVRVMVANPLDRTGPFGRRRIPRLRNPKKSQFFGRGSWERYRAEATRTYGFRRGRFEPDWSEADAKLFDLTVRRFAPGRTIEELLRELGSSFVGNGIGVTAIEPPILSTDDNITTLQPGMCLSVRLTLPSSVVRGETIVIVTQNASCL
ncbi:MAG: hypothetical protein ABSB35_36160 [Bryobacteraceae bacterium]|jgi:Xaa-Pro aminopeptidase